MLLWGYGCWLAHECPSIYYLQYIYIYRGREKENISTGGDDFSPQSFKFTVQNQILSSNRFHPSLI